MPSIKWSSRKRRYTSTVKHAVKIEERRLRKAARVELSSSVLSIRPRGIRQISVRAGTPTASVAVPAPLTWTKVTTLVKCLGNQNEDQQFRDGNL